MTDCDLIHQTINGDKEAFGKLYDQYAGVIRAVCFDSTREYSTAQDLTQEVFIRAYEKLDTLRNRDRFGAWILGIARLVCKEWIRQSVRERRQHTYAANLADIPVQLPSECPAQNLVSRSLTALPPRERIALHAYYLQGQSALQASTTLNMTESGFYRLLRRARRRLATVINSGRE